MPKKTSKPSTDPFHSRENANYDKPIASREHLLDLIAKQQVPMPQEQIAELLGYSEDVSLEALRRRLKAMVRDGQLFRNRRGGYLSFDHMDLQKGYVQSHPDGFGFVSPDDGSKDIFLPARQMRTLMNGDKVAVKIANFDKQRQRSEGALVAVLERANETLVGRYYRENGIDFVVPDDKRLVADILLKRDVEHSAKSGDVVLVRIAEYPSHHSQPVGVVVQVLGQESAPGMEVTIALNTHHIPHHWNEQVQESIKSLNPEVLRKDKQNRRDLRQLPFVTIDGSDARDFDDAVYCEDLDQGFRLFVAIADVAHYVPVDSALDLEACLRGTSVYFPGEVIPMLPEVLSNGLCSLNPEVDRLALVCSMEINLQGTVKQFEFFDAVIHSHARLEYGEVAEALIDGKKSEDAALNRRLPDLKRLQQVFIALQKARRRRHAIEFETREVVFHYNDERKIEAIEPYRRNQAHQIIEECMIAANISAARFLKKHKVPNLYRAHEGANQDKLPKLKEFLASFGIALTTDSPTPMDYAKIIEQGQERPEAEMIQTVVLRSMMQANYSPDSKLGHFGLALKDYAHFTSPIRRYPDLLVHRGIKQWTRQKSLEGFAYDAARMANLGESCSRLERRADDATRDASDWLKCEFLQKRVGQTFSGIVSAVTNFGLFVQLDDILIEGLIHVTALQRDYYQYDAAHHCLVGELTGRRYRLGDRLSVEVVRVGMEDRKIDFSLVWSDDEKAVKHTKGHKGKSVRSKGKKQGNSGARQKTEKSAEKSKSKPKSRSKSASQANSQAKPQAKSQAKSEPKPKKGPSAKGKSGNRSASTKPKAKQ